MNAAIDLTLVAPALLPMADRRFQERDVDGLLALLPSHHRLDFVHANGEPLWDRGLLERAFMAAYVSTNTNMARIDWGIVREILDHCDHAKIHADHLPPQRKVFYRLYRGVGRPDVERKGWGFSWTDRKKIAHEFARRNAAQGHEPTVFIKDFSWNQVLFYFNGRNEREYFILPEGWI